ncbi:epoxide hydrolase family protein [Humidisolicoccus flavus]|uniref:epoxide hydrolase family protein n=1 Tax=Humidisolicoccus flavus TaxID=3111414 RepID=UPI0032550033
MRAHSRKFSPFAIQTSDAQVQDLRDRLLRARLPIATPGAEWSRGIPVPLLDSLRTQWVEQFDWPALTTRLNTEHQYRYDHEATNLHFVHRAAHETDTLPVLTLHGWPYTFAQMLPLADALNRSRPLVAPSLPGFAFSPPLHTEFSARRVAELMHDLMTDLGYERYLVYGEDMGAPIADWIAGLYPESVAGIIATHPSFSAQARPEIELAPEERRFLATTMLREESGYALQQATRPDTLAAAVGDSPLGLLAWIIEKVAAWSDGGHATGIERFDPEELLTLVSLYWHTNSIGTSFRTYCEPGDFDAHPVVGVPAALRIQTHEAGYPRSLAEKSYLDIRSFERLKSGGHFTAWENPKAVADAIAELAATLS